MPQGFKNSPTLFGEALSVDLAAFPGETLNCTLLQFIDGMLLASLTQGDCRRGTKALLAPLSTTGYKVSWKKAQLCRQEVKYLGSVITKGHQVLGHERKQAICSIPRLNTKKEVREFLGAAGFCRIWILGFSEIAKPLFKATAGSGKDPLEWGPKQKKAFEEIKRLLTSAPALGLPDVTRDFDLFVHEKNHTALEVLTQAVGLWQPSCISVQTTGSSGCGLAAMPPGMSCNCAFGQRSRSAYSRTKYKCKRSPCCYCPEEQPGA